MAPNLLATPLYIIAFPEKDGRFTIENQAYRSVEAASKSDDFENSPIGLVVLRIVEGQPPQDVTHAACKWWLKNNSDYLAEHADSDGGGVNIPAFIEHHIPKQCEAWVDAFYDSVDAVSRCDWRFGETFVTWGAQ